MSINTNQFKEFDIADVIETAEDAKDYLDACLQLGLDCWLQALGDIAKAKGMSEFSKQTGLNRENLYRALKQGGNPNIKTIEKVLDAMGMSLKMVVKEKNNIASKSWGQPA